MYISLGLDFPRQFMKIVYQSQFDFCSLSFFTEQSKIVFPDYQILMSFSQNSLAFVSWRLSRATKTTTMSTERERHTHIIHLHIGTHTNAKTHKHKDTQTQRYTKTLKTHTHTLSSTCHTCLGRKLAFNEPIFSGSISHTLTYKERERERAWKRKEGKRKRKTEKKSKKGSVYVCERER